MAHTRAPSIGKNTYVVFRLGARRPAAYVAGVQPSSRFAEIFDWSLWAAWFAGLDRGFVFLLLLPFVVAVVGLWASFRESDRERDDE